ncbi:ATP-grasp fold amidoligase family protein [Globicatella sulfidifaciens]|uniref:Glycosyl transferase n=1 Tax=Globicatella sulfidifaciens TaxID=136093 RepID=A0A7X8C407_9LACT|nr:ATP-grasp fold amidoligase family protein [Globicatella sulfidifaciens]NLJ18270.1 glycosyl transferase [Globicatella sulfidifaciens]
MKKGIKRRLLQNNTIALLNDKVKEFYYKNLVTDEQLIKRQFKDELNRDVELENPTKFNDKLQWLKLNWYDPVAVKCADKYEVREIVKERIGEQYLNTLIAVYEDVDDIDIDKLPEKFVLKGTHGSGYNIICTDKSKMNWDNELLKMKRWLGKNHYYFNREWVYKDIKPRIICEKFLEEENAALPKDYKFFCFDGIPKFMFVASDRGHDTKFDFYDLDWNRIPVSQYHPNSNHEIPKPKELNEMIELAKKLSEGFPHVRVDFYVNKGKIIFGELTFFHFSGTKRFDPDEYEDIFGDYIDLSKIQDKRYIG